MSGEPDDDYRPLIAYIAMTAGEMLQPTQHEHSRAAVLQQADNTGLEKLSEVTVFAIPLFHQGDLVQLVYLPVPTKDVPTDGKSRVPQKLLDYAQKTQVKFTNMWQQWGQRDKGVRRRVHDMGQRQVENVSPESRFLTGVKRGTKQLTVYHPSSISDEIINQQMAAIAATQGKAEYWKLSAACAALPVAFAVDTLIIIGLPPMLTGYTGYLSYQHYKGATGASTLKKLGLGSAPQQPLSAGLPNLQQQQPGGDASSGQAYTGFAPQSSESAYATQPSSGMPSGQANYPSQGGTYPTGPPLQDYQSPPGGAVPSDSNPMTYQTMLDSLPSSGNAPGQGQAYNSVQYPSIETGGAAGQYPNPGGAPASVGIQPGTATGRTQGSSSGQAGAPAPTVGIEFVAVPMLDDYVSRVEQRPDGALSEEDILELCTAINAPDLVKPLMELKQRQLRMASKAKK